MSWLLISLFHYTVGRLSFASLAAYAAIKITGSLLYDLATGALSVAVAGNRLCTVDGSLFKIL